MSNSNDFVPPSYGGGAFHCPWCGAYAQQHWHPLTAEANPVQDLANPNRAINALVGRTMEAYSSADECRCNRCKASSYWVRDMTDTTIVNMVMVWPRMGEAPNPNPDLPPNCRATYDEARSVLALSPRSAAALLRLCLQQLLEHLGRQEKQVNDAIKELVGQGLPQAIQEALDAIRVIGNNAVHPLEMDINSAPEVAAAMFDLINLIVDDRITRPKGVSAMYAKLPQGARDAIARRDAGSTAT